MDDIEDMIGEEELDRAVAGSLRAPMVAPKPQFQSAATSSTAGSSTSGDYERSEPSVPGTQLIWCEEASVFGSSYRSPGSDAL
ncbi:hypothetical protein BBJ28_00015539 [Nothophytophthora sp. Chile5]|nr:hypothetical protein BBJ28_00015539 [Nothophytophthora sp. Chile5]